MLRERSSVSRSRVRFRSSHHKVAPFRISHRGVIEWTPPMKDVDQEDADEGPRDKKRKK
jgi:hypothetical protein